MFRRFDVPLPNNEENDIDTENWSLPSNYERFSSVNKPKSRLGRRRTTIEPSTKSISTLDNNETTFCNKASYNSSTYPKTPSHTHPVNNHKTPIFKRYDSGQKNSLVQKETNKQQSGFETPVRKESHFPLQEINNFPTTLNIVAKPVPEEDKGKENTSETVAKILNKSFECENGTVKTDLTDFFPASGPPEAHIDSSHSDICNNSSFMTARDFNFEKNRTLHESVFPKTPGKGYGLFNMLTSPLDPLAAVLTDDDTDTDKDTAKRTPTYYNNAKTPNKFQQLREMYTPSLKRISETCKILSNTPGEFLKNTSPLRKHKECHETYPQSFFQGLSDTCFNSSVDVKHLNRSSQELTEQHSQVISGSVQKEERRDVGRTPLCGSTEDRDSYINSGKRQLFEGLGWSCGPRKSCKAPPCREKDVGREKPEPFLSSDVCEQMDIDTSYSTKNDNQLPNSVLNGLLENKSLQQNNVMESVNSMLVDSHEISINHGKKSPKSLGKMVENEPQDFKGMLDLSGVVSLPEEERPGTPDEDSGKKTVVSVVPIDELKLLSNEEIAVKEVEKVNKETAILKEKLPILLPCGQNLSCKEPEEIQKSSSTYFDNLETVVLKEKLPISQSDCQAMSCDKRKEVEQMCPPVSNSNCMAGGASVEKCCWNRPKSDSPLMKSQSAGLKVRQEEPTSGHPFGGFPRQLMKPASNLVYVNNRPYTVMSMLGRGGSSEVYQVLEMNESKLMAMKIVNLSSVEETIAKGYLNEIQVLLKLQGCPSVIRMFDHEYLKDSKMLYVLMEKGDTDFSRLMKDIMKTKKISVAMITYYWTEMLNAVKDIHDKGIIHSDLKPANFLLVSGRLKLIDFGIASSLQGDMTSVLKDVTTGTFNYMSPEAIRNSGEGKGYKITYKSDVWSLGCILYNLVYGRTPFSHLTNTWTKLQAIADPHHSVTFPPSSALPPHILLSVKWALKKEPKERPTAGELLQLAEYTPGAETQLGRQISYLIAENIAQIFPNCDVKYELEKMPKPPSN